MRTDGSRLGGRSWIPALALAVLGSALLLPRLGDSGLWDPWEPVYAQTAREMAERGDWVVPYHRGEPRVNRPPLTYWLIGASHAVFGVNEFAARLPSALLALLCPLALCLALATRGRPWEGFLCGAALLTSPQWLLLGRFATLSMPLAAFLGLLLALVLGWPTLRGIRARRWAGAAVVVLVVLAALTNWPRGLLLPAWAVLGWGALRHPRGGGAVLLLVAAMYHAGQLLYWPWLILGAFAIALAAALWMLVRWGGLPGRVLLGGGVVVVALVAPWFLAVSQLPDELKVMNYKYALNLGESPGEHTGPYLDVLRMLALGGLPWAAAALAGLIRALRRDADDVARILGGAFIGLFLFFVLAESRMGHFTSVIQPAVAGLAAVGLAGMVRQRDWTAIPCGAALLAVAFVAWDTPAGILETATVRRSLGELDLAVPVLLAIAVWTCLIGVACWRKSLRWAVAAVLPAAIFAGGLAIGVVPALSAEKSTRALWDSYVADRIADEPLALVGPSEASVFYYSNNRVVRVDDERELAEFLVGTGRRYLIVDDEMLDTVANLPPEERRRYAPIDRSHPTLALLRFTPAEAATTTLPVEHSPPPD